jgi:hypothetical protein
VSLGENLISDCHAHSVVEDGDLNIGPNVIAQNCSWEISPAAVGFSVNKQSGFKLFNFFSTHLFFIYQNINDHYLALIVT